MIDPRPERARTAGATAVGTERVPLLQMHGIHQHFMLVSPLTVAENVVLGDERGGPVLDDRAIEKRVRELEERFAIAVEPGARVEDIPLGLQQRVEILKVLYRGSELLIFDER